MKGVLLFAAGALVGVVYTWGVYQVATPPQPTAQQICTEARAEIDGASEQACSDALDREQSIFLCNKAGTVCWTERL